MADLLLKHVRVTFIVLWLGDNIQTNVLHSIPSSYDISQDQVGIFNELSYISEAQILNLIAQY